MKNQAEKTIVLNPKLYPLPAIYGAAYVFIDKAYISFDGDPDKKVEVSFKIKPDCDPANLENIIGEFKNELLNYSLREQIVKSSQKVRESIIAQALLSPFYGGPGEEADDDYLDDPLGIAKTWEQRFEKKKAKSKC